MGSVLGKEIPFIDGSTVELEGYDTLATGLKVVTNAGTRVQLSAASVPCKKVFIQANDQNTGELVIGDVNVVGASGATRRGTALFASQGEWFPVSDLNLIYIDSTVNGEGVHFTYLN